MRLFIIFSFWAISACASGFSEDFYKLEPKERTQSFFAVLDPMFDLSFKKIEAELAFVQNFIDNAAKKSFLNVDKKGYEKLVGIKEKYRIKNVYNLGEYKYKLAPIPKAMGLAQALLESGGGTSLYARKYNNLFGEYSFYTENGQSKRRPRVFNSIQEAVDAFVLNLNRHKAYEEFRQLRSWHKIMDTDMDPHAAIRTLKAYSELQDIYMNRVSSIIKRYDLKDYDKQVAAND